MVANTRLRCNGSHLLQETMANLNVRPTKAEPRKRIPKQTGAASALVDQWIEETGAEILEKTDERRRRNCSSMRYSTAPPDRLFSYFLDWNFQ